MYVLPYAQRKNSGTLNILYLFDTPRMLKIISFLYRSWSIFFQIFLVSINVLQVTVQMRRYICRSFQPISTKRGMCQQILAELPRIKQHKALQRCPSHYMGSNRKINGRTLVTCLGPLFLTFL